MTCWTGEHWFYVCAGAVGLVIYLFGLPSGITLTLRWINTNKKHTDRNTIVAFGALYTKYACDLAQRNFVSTDITSTAVICDRKFPKAHQSLFHRYEAQAWWYEVIQVLKRTVFAFLAVGVPFSNASIQCLCAEVCDCKRALLPSPEIEFHLSGGSLSL